MKKNNKIKILLGLFSMLLSVIAMAQDAAKDGAEQATKVESPLNINTFLCIIAGLLLLPIYISGKSFLKSAKLSLKANKIATVIGLMLLSNFAVAAPSDTPPMISSNALSYIFITVIIIEVLVIALMNNQTKNFLSSVVDEKVLSTETQKVKAPNKLLAYWRKVNNFVPVEKEKDLDTGHNYDGIRELDNVTPPWFKAAFFASIVFAIIYLYTHHVSHSAPTQLQEFEIAMQKGEEEKAAYLSTQANNIDENNVKLLAGADIDAGKALFTQKCVACHKENAASAPGGVGPNLTDDYWIHGGSIKNVFTSIKNGWPEKGMISWKDQLSPKQIAQVASFVKSSKGSVKVGGKEPQGELYTDDAVAVNTTAVDSTKKISTK